MHGPFLCIHQYSFTYRTHINIYIHICTLFYTLASKISLYIYIHEKRSVYIYTLFYTQTYIYIYCTHTYIIIYTYIHVHFSVTCIYIYPNRSYTRHRFAPNHVWKRVTSVYIYIYLHKYIYIYTHIYTHTYAQKSYHYICDKYTGKCGQIWYKSLYIYIISMHSYLCTS